VLFERRAFLFHHSSSRRRPYNEPYPKETFTILIWGSDRAKFGAPETKYKDARVCVTGKITSYRGKPEVVATEPSQIVREK
jgi:hypothetical protein